MFLTKTLQDRTFVRTSVEKLHLVESGSEFVHFRSESTTRVRADIPSADLIDVEHNIIGPAGNTCAGLLRIDVVSDTVFRVRHELGSEVRPNATPMVVGQLNAPEHLQVQEDAGYTTLQTASTTLRVHEGGRLIFENALGAPVCAVGGPEKNDFRPWNSCNTDICQSRVILLNLRLNRALLELGVCTIKTDFGEQAPIEGVYYDGTPGFRMRNLYPLLYNEAVAEVSGQVHGNGFVWARSA